MLSRHDYAYVKNADKCWFKCDDQKVSPATLEDVLREQQNVYMLFYLRQTVPKNDGVICHNIKSTLSVNSSVNTKSKN